MKYLFFVSLFICFNMANAQQKQTTESTIIGLEKAALERWNNGDPSGYLEIYTPDVTYFDPFLEKRLDGLDTITKLYEPIKGKVHVDSYEMIDPLVQASDKMAVLTFNLNSYYDGGKCQKWNCTEVYRLEPSGQWKIIQTHWSLTKPQS
jgi:ketosteroid isomerase-like protein